MLKLITANSYFELFDILTDELKGKTGALTGKNLVFCEEKVSLMAERKLCDAFECSFNTEVYSFGNFLRAKKPLNNLLSKEGSAMVVRKVISGVSLECFKHSKKGLAPALYELIIQLKSSRVTPLNISDAADSVSGILKGKLKDIAAVYSGYEEFISGGGYLDQSSVLNTLPEEIEKDEEIKNADVYVVGYSSFTRQIKDIISALVRTAKSVTAILTAGENEFAFVNETAKAFGGGKLLPKVVDSRYSECGRIIADGLFNPLYERQKKARNQRVFGYSASSPRDEIEKVAGVIKQEVMAGGGKLRYKDIAVILPDTEAYRSHIKDLFGEYEIPYFLDEKKKPLSHPLITLIKAYVEVFRKSFSRNAVLAFCKNPLVCADKGFLDEFENYLIKYGIDYGRIKAPFIFPAKTLEQADSFERFRAEICELLDGFNVDELLKKLNAEDKLSDLGEKLKALGEREEFDVNNQIYGAVNNVLEEMKKILGNPYADYAEFKRVFESGVSALELSIIPQYNDAVFTGGFKEAALAPAKYLFAVGLTSAVPKVKLDVALLTDGDINVFNALPQIDKLIEPKIQIVNHRSREETALGLAAFKERLYLSYPMADGGAKTVKSEVLAFMDDLFPIEKFPEVYPYLTKKQGLKNYAKDCDGFASGVLNDFSIPAAYYHALNGGIAEKLADYSNMEMKISLDDNRDVLIKDVTSASVLEDFHKCPYYSFIKNGLKVNPREESEINSLSVGLLMHDIFKGYIAQLDSVSDRATSDSIFDGVAEKLIASDKYKKYTFGDQTSYALSRTLEECKNYCYDTYRWISHSNFKIDEKDLEVKFGDGKRYKAIPLLDGKIKISGTIDRIDTFRDAESSNEYYRIIDYKTGGYDNSSKALIVGTKLQLWLYSSAIEGKKLAGAYYSPISDGYLKRGEEAEPMAVGRTLNAKASLAAEKPVKGLKVFDESKQVSEETLKALQKYAVKISEKAVNMLSDGVIVPSPYEGTCEYCEYYSLCQSELPPRKFALKRVTDDYIASAVKEKDEDGKEA